MPNPFRRFRNVVSHRQRARRNSCREMQNSFPFAKRQSHDMPGSGNFRSIPCLQRRFRFWRRRRRLFFGRLRKRNRSPSGTYGRLERESRFLFKINTYEKNGNYIQCSTGDTYCHQGDRYIPRLERIFSSKMEILH